MRLPASVPIKPTPISTTTIGTAIQHSTLKHNDGDHPTVNLIVASPEPNRVNITIADNGPGLSEMEQQVIRANEETALQHSLGIGLWTTSWLVNQLSGDIQVTATEGEGTSIAITIPGEKSE